MKRKEVKQIAYKIEYFISKSFLLKYTEKFLATCYRSIPSFIPTRKPIIHNVFLDRQAAC